MRHQRKTTESTRVRGTDRPFLQPLAVAFVCAVLICLLLMMGLMDLRTLDKTLVGFMENRGVDIIRNVQQIAEYNLQRLMEMEEAGLSAEAGPPFTEDAFSLQESLIIDLAELGQEIDFKWDTDPANNAQLRSLAAEESLWLIAFLDETGAITAESRPVPKELLSTAGPVIKGYEEIKISIFDRSRSDGGVGLVALRRKSGRKGTIILALDGGGFRYRSSRTAIQRAIEEVGRVSGIAYFQVMDQRNRVIGQAGEPAQMDQEKPATADFFKGGAGVASQKIVLGEKKLLEIFAPIRLDGGFVGSARLGLPRDRADRILKKERGWMFIYVTFMAAIAFLSVWFLYKNQNRHMARMQEVERQLHQAERLSALGRLAAGVAHEIRNPLNAISMASQRLQRENLQQLTGVIRDEIRRLNHIIEEFLSLSKSRSLEFQRHDIRGLLRQIVLLMGEETESKGVTIKTRWDDLPIMISMDFDKLKQALFNIIKNAVESIPKQGSIDLSVEPKDRQWVSIKISDSGTGLTAKEIEHIFDLDYTTKEKGLGLGLPLAHEIIRGHGGEIRVRSQPGAGSIFEVLLPCSLSAG